MVRGREFGGINGTTIRFMSMGRFTYAAIRAEGRWYFTGENNFFGQALTDDELLSILHQQSITNVEVATRWFQLY